MSSGRVAGPTQRFTELTPHPRSLFEQLLTQRKTNHPSNLLPICSELRSLAFKLPPRAETAPPGCWMPAADKGHCPFTLGTNEQIARVALVVHGRDLIMPSNMEIISIFSRVLSWCRGLLL